MEGLIYVHTHLHNVEALNIIAKIITLLGDGGRIWLLIAAVMLCFKKTRKCACVLVISLALGQVFNEFILKHIFMRTRPFTINEDFKVFLESIGIDPPSSYSFPSGHSLSSFNCAMVITLFNKKHGYYAFPLAALIALSRIYLCVHFPTDVLAGAIIGMLFAVAMVAIYRKIIWCIEAYKRKQVREAACDSNK